MSFKSTGMIAWLASMCLLTATTGCYTNSSWILPSRSLAISDAQVFSGSWTNYNGRVMRLISSFVQSSKMGGDFMITKVGDKELNKAYVCEIYRVTHIPDQEYRGGTHNLNYLLARTGDISGHFFVDSVKMRDATNKIFFTIDLRVNPGYMHFQPDFSGLGSTGTNLVRYPQNDGVLYDFVFTKNYRFSKGFMAYSGKPLIPSE
jgi:hypothetical protein